MVATLSISPDLSTSLRPVVIDDFVPSRSLSALYRALSHRNLPGNLLWMPVSGINDSSIRLAFNRYTGMNLADTVTRVGALLIDHAARLRPGVQVVGFEVWSGVTFAGQVKSFLHRDIDEGRKLAFGTTRCSLASSILHLGPRSGLEGGQTLIWADSHVPRKLEAFVFQGVDATALRGGWGHNWHEVSQRAGRLVLFDGGQPHMVTSVEKHPPNQPRVALLINAWELPLNEAVGRFGRLHARGFQALTSMSVAELRALISAATRSGLRKSADALIAVRTLTAIDYQ